MTITGYRRYNNNTGWNVEHKWSSTALSEGQVQSGPQPWPCLNLERMSYYHGSGTVLSLKIGTTCYRQDLCGLGVTYHMQVFRKPSHVHVHD